MLNVKEAAQWFICHNPELASGYIDENTKVNKLLYFSNLMYYCVNHEVMFDEGFVAFPNGPVVFSVYRDYRYHGLNALPRQSPRIEGGQGRQMLDIINFVYGGMSADQLVREAHTHSLWRDVRHLIPGNPQIDFSKVEPELAEYNRALYRTYADMDFDILVKEKICGNIYYYLKDSFVMTDDIVERLSRFGRYGEPKFLEYIDGELVIS